MTEPTRHQIMVNAITDTCRVAETGEYVVDPAEAVTCLAVAIGIVMEIAPTLVTLKQMREASEKVARKVRYQVKFVREEYERTGERPWGASAVHLN